LIDTKIILKSVVNTQTGIKAKPLLSHISALSFPALGRTLLMTDGAMNIQPGVNEKIQIIENVLVVAKALDIAHPLIGLVGPVEKVNPKIQSTVDADQIRLHFLNSIGFTVDGPLAIDNLVSVEAAIHKGIQSPVAGKADILIFPNLDSGNVFYKSSVFLSGASAASIIVGAMVPIVLTSRADNHETKFNSIVLGGLISDQLFDVSHQPR
jgi:phosphate butyryltransferase